MGHWLRDLLAKSLNYRYGPDGRLTNVVSTGEGTSGGTSRGAFTYDELGRLSELRHTGESGADVLVELGEYDGTGLKPTRVYRPIERTTRLRYTDGQLIAIDEPRDEARQWRDITRLRWTVSYT